MKKTGNDNINSKYYWDYIYTNKKDQEALEKKSHFTEEWGRDERSQATIKPSKRFVTALGYVNEGDKVLDIGCGFGLFTGAVINKYPFNEVWGVDISSKVIEDNRLKHPEVVYHQQYVGHLDKVPDNYFDVVFSGEVMEHLDEPELLFSDAFTALKSGGTLIITTPLGVAIDSPEHVWYFEREDVIKLFTDNGFEDVQLVNLPEMEKTVVIFATGIKK